MFSLLAAALWLLVVVYFRLFDLVRFVGVMCYLCSLFCCVWLLAFVVCVVNSVVLFSFNVVCVIDFKIVFTVFVCCLFSFTWLLFWLFVVFDWFGYFATVGLLVVRYLMVLLAGFGFVMCFGLVSVAHLLVNLFG